MTKFDETRIEKRKIERETDAEVAFGAFLERSDVDCDAFMKQWRINRNQFNAISHYLYGLTDNLSMLPSALSAMLIAGRDHPIAPTRETLPASS